jgi:hypothetical protein
VSRWRSLVQFSLSKNEKSWNVARKRKYIFVITNVYVFKCNEVSQRKDSISLPSTVLLVAFVSFFPYIRMSRSKDFPRLTLYVCVLVHGGRKASYERERDIYWNRKRSHTMKLGCGMKKFFYNCLFRSASSQYNVQSCYER